MSHVASSSGGLGDATLSTFAGVCYRVGPPVRLVEPKLPTAASWLRADKLWEEVKIMNVHLKQIPAEGIHLEGEEAADFLDIDESAINPVGQVEYSLDAGISGAGLIVTGTLRVDVELECVSCLKRFIYPIHVRNFAAQIELKGPEMVDLTPWVREDILLALPAHPHCDWDGKTKCAGLRLKDLTVTEGQKTPNAWDALDALNLNRRK